NLDRIFSSNPTTAISASGSDVGLPDGQMGNSEVGHLNIGAGRIVYQELTRISKAIRDGDFFQNRTLLDAVAFVKEKPNRKLHLIGLFSDGGVHSHLEHMYALLRLAKQQGIEDVFVHAFTDGRDTGTNAGLRYLKEFEEVAAEIGVGKMASVSGRYYAMDRDKRWERIEKAYRTLTEGSDLCYDSAESIFEQSYASGVTDEFIVPASVCKDGKPIALIEDGDAVIFYNFRPDRARQISRAFLDDDFVGFSRKKPDIHFVGMTQYDATIHGIHTAYLPQSLKNTLGEYASDFGMKQLRIAETEKYAHVTFFFGGGVEKPYEGEERILVDSPKVTTYDLKPEMSAYEVADRLVEQVARDCFDIIICNFANPDMVGHTGVYEAAVKAVEAVDTCVGRVVEALEAVGAGYIITADHGNSECMTNPDGTPMTAHTTNPVPLVIGGCGDLQLREGGILTDHFGSHADRKAGRNDGEQSHQKAEYSRSVLRDCMPGSVRPAYCKKIKNLYIPFGNRRGDVDKKLESKRNSRFERKPDSGSGAVDGRRKKRNSRSSERSVHRCV
ncbi:MAG: 2,3-bisphosphoglycerate-independent phosphoglycerate mutase, partial [Bacillota bacterium]|nr:2,3-bisphosphoglycerate-independent phosphoglycerate mutase [Bacillota bacterium]